MNINDFDQGALRSGPDSRLGVTIPGALCLTFVVACSVRLSVYLPARRNLLRPLTVDAASSAVEG